LEAEPLDQKLLERGIQNLEEDIQKRIIRRKGLDGKLTYYLANRNPDYQSHLTGDVTSNEYPIPSMVFSNASEEFKSDELKRFVNNFKCEFQIERADFFGLKNETIENILKLLEKGKLSPETILSVGNLHLAEVLNYIKTKNPQMLEKIIKENLKFINKLKTEDRIYYDDFNFFDDELILSTYSKDPDLEVQVTEFLKNAKFHRYTTEALIKGLLKTEMDIAQVYRVINFAKEKDEKFWNEFNPIAITYFNFENYLKLSPDLESCIKDFNEFIDKRKPFEKEKIEFSDSQIINSQIIKSIFFNLFKNNQLDEFFKNDQIDKSSKDFVLKYILEKIGLMIYDLNLDDAERKNATIKILEIIKSNTDSNEQIISINSNLLQKYDKDDPKLTPLILEIKKSDKETFYSSMFSIERIWQEFPEKRMQLYEDILQNKNLLFLTRKDFSDENKKTIYYNSFSRLLKLIEKDFRDSLLSQTYSVLGDLYDELGDLKNPNSEYQLTYDEI
jgi:hypothetical protein